jgi:F0F1-type ATP synthase alpha subunit
MATQNTILENLKNEINKYKVDQHEEKVGYVTEIFDGITRVSGLSTIRASELVEFANGAQGVALNLEEETVGVIVLGDSKGIHEGMVVKSLGRILDIPVGDALLGRVITPLGICGSGIGVTIAANRFKGIRAGHSDSVKHVQHGRENDHTNVLALAADDLTTEQAEELIKAFIAAQPKPDEKYKRRAQKLDN